MWYELLNIFFFVFHSFIVLFNTFGWIFRKARRWNLLCLMLTGASWFILGIWYGWGYCVCTHWHWMVREKLGLYDTSQNYIHLLILKTTGIDMPEKPLETGIMIIFGTSLTVSIILNIRDRMKGVKNTR
jgi:hypothetical protein